MSEFDVVVEKVPPFIKRDGDIVIQGSNNSTIILGTDRAKNNVAKVSDGLGSVKSENGGKEAGSCHIVVGRKDEDGNLDFDKDSAYQLISMKSNVDKTVNSSNIESDAGKTSCIISKADCIRTSARKDIKIFIDNNSYIFINDEQCVIKINDTAFIKIKEGNVTVNAKKIELGEKAEHPAILGDVFTNLFKTHTHTVTAVGSPTGPPLVPLEGHLSQKTFLDK